MNCVKALIGTTTVIRLAKLIATLASSSDMDEKISLCIVPISVATHLRLTEYAIAKSKHTANSPFRVIFICRIT